MKDITGAVAETSDSAADIAAGAVISAAEAFTSPAETVRRHAGRLERKGAPARRRAHREVASAAADAQETADDIAGALLPERIALRGLSLVKARARRVDLVGELAYRGLDLFHDSLKEIARALNRLERASQPPARPRRSVSRAASTSAAQARGTARRGRRAAGTRARRTTTRARRTTTRASRSTASRRSA